MKINKKLFALFALVLLIGSVAGMAIVYWTSQQIPHQIVISGLNAWALGSPYNSYANKIEATSLQTVNVDDIPYENAVSVALGDYTISNDLKVSVTVSGLPSGIVVTWNIRYACYWYNGAGQWITSTWHIGDGLALTDEAVVPLANVSYTTWKTPIDRSSLGSPTLLDCNTLLISFHFDTSGQSFGVYDLNVVVKLGE